VFSELNCVQVVGCAGAIGGVFWRVVAITMPVEV
jgi:hypothetical protein